MNEFYRFDDRTFPPRISLVDSENNFEIKSKNINGSAVDIAKEKIEQKILSENTFKSFRENDFMKKAFSLFEPECIEIKENK
jgi:hypothetical protein